MFFRIVGNVFILGALLSLAYVGLTVMALVRDTETSSSTGVQAELSGPPPVLDRAVPETSAAETLVQPAPEEPDELDALDEAAELAETVPEYVPVPITWLRFPRLGINAEVVPSKYVQLKGGGTWLVPAFKVGHAEYTGGAGQKGNAILLGHVTSRGLGNVFEKLERARVDDVVQITGASGDFAYRVVEVRRVPRTDVSVVEPTSTAAITLITCTGRWLPQLQDYAERVVVRGELV